MTNKRKLSMWLHWCVFVSGLTVGKLYKAVPVITVYALAGASSLALWNRLIVRTWLVPRATIVDVIAFVVLVRMVGRVWRGETNPTFKKSKARDFYE